MANPGSEPPERNRLSGSLPPPERLSATEWNDSRPWRVYFAGFVAGAGLSWLIILGTIYLVDPYGLHGASPLNVQRRFAIENSERMHKAYAVARVDPVSVALGTSTVSWGIPADTLPQPAYNLGLRAATLREQRRYFEHAVVDSGRVKLLVWGLDLFAFFTRRGESRGGFDQGRLAQLPDAAAAPPWFASGLFSLDAFFVAGKTLALQRGAPLNYPGGLRDPEHMAETAARNLRREVQINIRGRSGEWTRHAHLPEAYDAYDEYRAVLELCKERDIEVRAYISPLHAWQMEVLKQVGSWPFLEEWKTRLAQIHAEMGGESGAPLPLRDFAGSHPFARELRDLNTKNWKPLEYWYDGAHFRPTVARPLLERLMSDEPTDERFGRLLTPANVQGTLVEDREAHEAFMAEHPEHRKFVSEHLRRE